jgi:hypothetical protein
MLAVSWLLERFDLLVDWSVAQLAAAQNRQQNAVSSDVMERQTHSLLVGYRNRPEGDLSVMNCPSFQRVK